MVLHGETLFREARVSMRAEGYARNLKRIDLHELRNDRPQGPERRRKPLAAFLGKPLPQQAPFVRSEPAEKLEARFLRPFHKVNQSESSNSPRPSQIVLAERERVLSAHRQEDSAKRCSKSAEPETPLYDFNVPEEIPFQAYWIAGSWNQWQPEEMNWDHVRGCFQFNVQLGSDSFESFQLLLNGRWETCLYPDRPCSSCHSNVVILGPDAGGGDFCWTMGLHHLDEGFPGACCEVRVFVGEGNEIEKVDWVLLSENSEQHKMAKAPLSRVIVGDLSTIESQRFSQRASFHAEMRRTLCVAWPERTGEKILALESKFSHMGIESLTDLLLALRGDGDDNLNQMLRAHGERPLSPADLYKLKRAAQMPARARLELAKKATGAPVLASCDCTWGGAQAVPQTLQ